MSVRGISDRLINKTRQLWFVIGSMVVIGLGIIVMYPYQSPIGKNQVVYLGTYVFLSLLSLALIVPVIELISLKNVINIIGKHLKANFDEEGITVRDQYRGKPILKHFRWREIQQVEVQDRTLFSIFKKVKLKIISFVIDVDQYTELIINKNKRNKLQKHSRDQMLDCYFEIEYSEDVMQYITNNRNEVLR